MSQILGTVTDEYGAFVEQWLTKKEHAEMSFFPPQIPLGVIR
jgi:hypothetical protein